VNWLFQHCDVSINETNVSATFVSFPIHSKNGRQKVNTSNTACFLSKVLGETSKTFNVFHFCEWEYSAEKQSNFCYLQHTSQHIKVIDRCLYFKSASFFFGIVRFLPARCTQCVSAVLIAVERWLDGWLERCRRKLGASCWSVLLLDMSRVLIYCSSQVNIRYAIRTMCSKYKVNCFWIEYNLNRLCCPLSTVPAYRVVYN